MGGMGRRGFLGGAGSLVAMGRQAAAEGANGGDDRCYRIRAETLDELLAGAKASAAAGKLPRTAYPQVVEWLYAAQSKLYAEVREHQFTDLTEGTFWQRSRLKFPSAIDRERAALKESK